jgi:hypothetical protein
MTFVSKLPRIAASSGSSLEQQQARRDVATDFFAKNVYETGGDWDEARRALQCFDFTQPVILGPSPAAPPRLVAMVAKPMLLVGFFAEKAPATLTKPTWWTIAPEAPYLKWFLPFVTGSEGAGASGDARFFVPAARRGMSILARPT